MISYCLAASLERGFGVAFSSCVKAMLLSSPSAIPLCLGSSIAWCWAEEWFWSPLGIFWPGSLLPQFPLQSHCVLCRTVTGQLPELSVLTRRKNPETPVCSEIELFLLTETITPRAYRNFRLCYLPHSLLGLHTTMNQNLVTISPLWA